MKLKTIKQDTWLPLFQGYYNTIFDESDRFVESELEMSDDELREHYSEVFDSGVTIEYFRENFWEYLDFAKGYNGSSEYIAHSLIELDHSNIIKDVTYQKLCSPKYYNFSNDSINVEIEYSPDKLIEFINSNLEEFKSYIESKYTSRDGFISSYSNDVNDWLEIIRANELCDHSLGSVLEFVFTVNYGSLNDASYELYEESNCYEGFMNEVEFDYKRMIQNFQRSQAS